MLILHLCWKTPSFYHGPLTSTARNEYNSVVHCNSCHRAVRCNPLLILENQGVSNSLESASKRIVKCETWAHSTIQIISLCNRCRTAPVPQGVWNMAAIHRPPILRYEAESLVPAHPPWRRSEPSRPLGNAFRTWPCLPRGFLPRK